MFVISKVVCVWAVGGGPYGGHVRGRAAGGRAGRRRAARAAPAAARAQAGQDALQGTAPTYTPSVEILRYGDPLWLS